MKRIGRIVKGFVGALACGALLACGLAVTAPQQAQAAGMSVAQLQSKFPNNSYWNHPGKGNSPDSYSWTPCKHGNHDYYGKCGCNSYNNAIQCMGFAYKLANDVYGTNARSWAKIYNLNSLKPGDIIRYQHNGHSVFVTNVSGNTVTYGECLGDSGCKIRWNRTESKSSIGKTLTYVQSAPYAIPNPTPANKITLSGATYPTTLQKGKPYPVKGTITSPSKITYVSAAVYSTSGKWETGGSTNPNSYSYNLAGLDSKVIYNNLGAGTHVYKVYAKNSSGQVCLLSKQFTVTSGYKAPYASGANAPTSIKYGKFFGLKGMVYGNGSNLQQVTAAVYTPNGTWKTGRTINVNTGSVDIAKSLDPYVVFNHLPRGTYYYKVIAKNAAGTYTLVNKQFKVY